MVGQALELARLMREPAVVVEFSPTTSRRRHRRPLPGDARGLQGDRPRRRPERHGADHGRKRHGQGVGGAGDLSARLAGQAPFRPSISPPFPRLLESELFGHEKGAFTGPIAAASASSSNAHGGTLFLDEIGDMPLAMQAKILRLLEDQTFERVGGNETIRTDVRLIAATHRDLKAWSPREVSPRSLLSAERVHDPPASLRERGDDLAMLVHHYLRRFDRELGREVLDIAPEALERLRYYAWPGNIRELQSVLKQALIAVPAAAC